MKELWKRVLIYGSYVTIYITAMMRISNEDIVGVVTLFSLVLFIILYLLYELNAHD